MATTLRPRPAALILTPNAEARIAELMAKGPEGAIGVKLSTPRRGCSGLAYSVDYVTEAKPFDEKIETPAERSTSMAARSCTSSDRRWIGSKTTSPRASCSRTPTPRALAVAGSRSLFDFDRWRPWLAQQEVALRAKGYEVRFVDVSPQSLTTNKPSYCFQLSTPRLIGQMSVWSSGECDFDIVNVETEELKPDLWGLAVDDTNFEGTFAKFCSLMTAES